MNRRYRTPAPVAIVTGIVLILFGTFCLLMNLTNMQENSRFIENADAVVGECTSSGDGTGSSQSYLKTTVKYVYDGKSYDNIVIDNYGQFFLSGYRVDLFVNPDCPTQCKIVYKTGEGVGKNYTIFTFMGLGVGTLMVVVAIKRIKHGQIW